MITLVLAFPHGRYAATPWGESPDAIELPPSPWRLLRALYATWRGRRPDLDEATVHGLLLRLAEPPAFDVPRHGVLDGVALFERNAELAVHWSVELTGAQHDVLTQLVAAIPYLGRADSRCSARLESGWLPSSHDSWSAVDLADSVPQRLVATALLAPTLPLHVDTLLAVPAEVRRHGLPMPPGTRLIGYQRDPRRPAAATGDATAVRFAIACAARPPATHMITYTDLLRRAALSRLGRLRVERERTVLGGKTAVDRPMQDQHIHAHYLPLCGEGRLDGFVVWAPGGLHRDELKAVTSIDALRSATIDRLPLRLIGAGPVAELVPDLARASSVWRSITPFTPSRYPNRNATWTDFAAAEIGREAGYRGLPMPRTVTTIEGDPTLWRRDRPSVRRRHDKRPQAAGRRPVFLELEFGHPVKGPVVLGQLSHFGLGLFVPQ